MSKRSDILEPSEWISTKRTGLVYSEVLGWIDLGHAQGGDITKLLGNINQGESGLGAYYQVEYSQKMYVLDHSAGTGKFIRWKIKKGLSLNEIHSIALSMMFACAAKFESYQSQWFFSWYTDSGFSGEDLSSDLLGFYRVVYPGNYQKRLKLISKKDALKRWDHYGAIGNYKNKGFLPLLFPDPDKNPAINKPVQGELPNFMKLVQPFKDFDSGKVSVISDDGTYFSFLSGGKREP
ncbi:hypothetical protein SIL08_00970 [Scandinavium sp. V105_16]|uniref:Uncharacterized protein n=1 Tax=Scandinavium lactucae TaxID=3095028 RepID=A0AAJ2S318_9ENTR|nr:MULTISPECIES: hypothetical protein [unclassified Scandinavium]MDX6018868.1 hypothetical protein [Scandinavium sp. V105_16]MDX6030170.1 hypothetical protein [Scandinavium sp. V105_12]